MRLTPLTHYIREARDALTVNKYFTVLVTTFFFLSLAAFWINNHYFQYPGNTYFSFEALWVGSILLFIYSGCCLQFGTQSQTARKAREVFHLFSIMALILLGCNAIQYTPFTPIDQRIIDWGQWMNIDLTQLVRFSHKHPKLYQSMDFMYDSMALQMTYLPLILIFFGQFKRVHEYYFLLLLTALIGYSFYYFFPTIAPASMMKSPYFSEAQHATGLKFYQIHHYIPPTTIEGGMIAFPSFHAIWAWLCVFLVRTWLWPFRILLAYNTGIVFSCVFLGWHYILDIIASVLVLCIAHYAMHRYQIHRAKELETSY